MHRPVGSDDVTDIPAFNVFQYVGGQAFFIHVELDLPGYILNDDEGATLTHHTTCHSGVVIQRFKLSLVFIAEGILQLDG